MMTFICFCQFCRKVESKDEDTDTRHPPADLSGQSIVQDTPMPQKQALAGRVEAACSSVKACAKAVLSKLGFPARRGSPPTAQRRAGPEPRPASSVRRRRNKPVPPTLRFRKIRKATQTTPIPQSGPGLHDTDARRPHAGTGWPFSPVASSDDSLSLVDARTPSELRAIPLIYTPDEVSLPPTLSTLYPPSTTSAASPKPKRIELHLPVRGVGLQGRACALKDVGGGYQLLTAQHQLNVVLRRLERLELSSAACVTQTPPAPLSPTPSLISATSSELEAPEISAPDTTPQAEDSKDQSGLLPPLLRPEDGLSESLIDLASLMWEEKVRGLSTIRALAQHHPEILKLKLHKVCLAIIDEIKNMRSMVASAAIETVTSLFVNLKREMDNEVEGMGSALLVRAANTSQNASLLESLSMSLRAMVQNCSPPRVLTVLLNIGLSHLSSPVRAVTALQLHLLADRLGAAAVLKAGPRFTSRFLIAVSKMLMDATAPVRAHGHAILKELAKQRDFMKLWKQYVPEKDQRFLEKTVTNAVRAAC